MKVTVDIDGDYAALGRKLAEAVAAECRGVAREVAEQTARHMRAHHRYKDRTGRLTRAMRARLHAMTARGAEWLFYVDAARAPYAVVVDRGSLPHRIEGNPYLAFYWEKEGRDVVTRSVRHRGTKSYAIEDDAVDYADSIIEAMTSDALTRVLAKFGT